MQGIAMGKARKGPVVATGELELLGILWEHGPLSLSEVHARMVRPVGYTTVQTRLNRLVDKGLAERVKRDRRPALYSAAVDPEEISVGALDQLVGTALRSRVVPLVAHLVEQADLSPEELDELERLVESARARLGASESGGEG